MPADIPTTKFKALRPADVLLKDEVVQLTGRFIRGAMSDGGSNTITINVEYGKMTLGGKGTDGDLSLTDKKDKNRILFHRGSGGPGVGPNVRVLLNGENARLKLGGDGAKGEILVTDARGELAIGLSRR